jgi:4-alpha-glucanotransferase
VYPGTHDNNTTLGWYRDASPKEKDHVRSYLRVDGREIGWDFVRSAYAAVSRLAVIPMQDLLSLGGDARFNTPGVAAGNWQWRYSESQLQTLHTQSASYLKSLGEVYGRS